MWLYALRFTQALFRASLTPRVRTQRGFALFEVMIAIAIFASVILVLGQSQMISYGRVMDDRSLILSVPSFVKACGYAAAHSREVAKKKIKKNDEDVSFTVSIESVPRKSSLSKYSKFLARVAGELVVDTGGSPRTVSLSRFVVGAPVEG